MIEVVLNCSTPDGSQKIAIEKEKTSFGRGDADFRLDDDGLSRLHASVFRDGDKVWIVDENSTNGTFVNGGRVSATGTPLQNGDTIKIGNYTNLKVVISNKQAAPKKSFGSSKAQTFNPNQKKNESVSAPNSALFLPLTITAFALLIVAAAAIFIGVQVFGGSGSDAIVYKSNDAEFGAPENFDDEESEKKTEKSPTPKPEKTTVGQTNANLTDSPEALNDGSQVALPSGKKYQAMSDEEKNRYIAVKAEKVARIIGNQASEPIPPEAIAQIKNSVSAYASRVNSKPLGGCRFGDNLQVTLERASKNAPFINRHFNAEGIEPQIGLYVAMIESEHCPCLESPTHAKGVFQFLASTAPDYGLDPNQRCEPEPSAKAAAKYLKSLIGRFGTASDSVPLAIASYNSGQGNLSNNLDKVFAATANQKRNFWTLAANKSAMQGNAAKQFANENIKYVPKFFAAAIIGENPQDFGLSLQPLSTYTK